MPVLALLNAQWRGGSTVAEQLLFTTIASKSLFLLDEPAMKLLVRAEKRSKSSMAQALFEALRCDFHQYNRSGLVSWQVRLHHARRATFTACRGLHASCTCAHERALLLSLCPPSLILPQHSDRPVLLRTGKCVVHGSACLCLWVCKCVYA